MRVSDQGYYFDQTANECKLINLKWENCEASNYWAKGEDCIKECEGEEVFEAKRHEKEMKARKNRYPG